MAQKQRKKARTSERGDARRFAETSFTAQAKPSKKRKKKSDPFLFWAVAILLPCGALFYLSQQGGGKDRLTDSKPLDQPGTKLTVEERIKEKKATLKLEQDMHRQEAQAEKFKKPVKKMDPPEPEISPLDMGVRFSDDASMQEMSKDLADLPFKNDIYEDPEDVVRRKLAQEEWLEQQLREKNEWERREFIRRFVKIAKEQGYNVYFTKDMKAILEPIPEEEKKKEEEFEKIQISW